MIITWSPAVPTHPRPPTQLLGALPVAASGLDLYNGGWVDGKITDGTTLNILLNLTYTRMLAASLGALCADGEAGTQQAARAGGNLKLLEAVFESMPQLYIQTIVIVLGLVQGGSGLAGAGVYISVALSVLSITQAVGGKTVEMLGGTAAASTTRLAGTMLYYIADAVSRALGVAVLFALPDGGSALAAGAGAYVVLDMAVQVSYASPAQPSSSQARRKPGSVGEALPLQLPAAATQPQLQLRSRSRSNPPPSPCLNRTAGALRALASSRSAHSPACAQTYTLRACARTIAQICTQAGSGCWHNSGCGEVSLLGAALSLFSSFPLSNRRRDRGRLCAISAVATAAAAGVALAVGERGESTAAIVCLGVLAGKLLLYATAVHGLEPAEGVPEIAGGAGAVFVLDAGQELQQMLVWDRDRWAQFFADPGNTELHLNRKGVSDSTAVALGEGLRLASGRVGASVGLHTLK